MKATLISILALSILAGQLIKLKVSGSSGGIILLDISILALCLYSIPKLNFRNLINPPLTFKLAYFFILTGFISLIFTPLNLSLSEYFVSLSYLLRFSLYIFLMYCLYSKIFGDLKKTAVTLLLSTGIGLSVLGILQLIFIPNVEFLTSDGWDPHYFRTISTFLDPNFVGVYFVLTLILITLLLKGKVKTKLRFITGKKLLLIYFLAVYLALLTTFSRGSYLVFSVSFLTLSFLLRSQRLLLLTILLISSLLVGFKIYSVFIAETRNINRDQSAISRLGTWEEGAIIFQKSPFLGVGFNAYPNALKEYNLAPLSVVSKRGGSTNDSSLLYVAATTGIVGLAFYVLFLISILKSALRNIKSNNYWGLLTFSSLIGIITGSFFANILFYPLILIWLIVSTANLDLD